MFLSSRKLQPKEQDFLGETLGILRTFAYSFNDLARSRSIVCEKKILSSKEIDLSSIVVADGC